MHTAEPDRCLEGLELVFVELTKFRPDTLSTKRLQVLWLRFLTEIRDQTEQVSADLLAVPEVAEAVKYLRESAFTKDELAGYDRYWDSISSERTLIAAAIREGLAEGRRTGKAEGKAEGIVEGKAEGLAGGIAEGIARGKQEQSLAQARLMRAKGFDNATIQELTGLSSEALEAL